MDLKSNWKMTALIVVVVLAIMIFLGGDGSGFQDLNRN